MYSFNPFISPYGLYDDPSTSKCFNLLGLSFSTIKNCSTHISFVVKVPVLSEQIIVVHPKVSTLSNFLF